MLKSSSLSCLFTVFTVVTMCSLGSHLALHNSSMLHSFVDSFFLGKKALVKDRLRQSMETIVDGLFEEMVGQVKEMLLPPKEGSSSGFESTTTTTTDATPSKAAISSLLVTENPKSKMIFAANSKPGPFSSSSVPLSQPFSGLYKRMAENDGSYNNRPDKKKAVTVELQIDGPLDDENGYGDVDIDDGAGGGGVELTNNSSSALLDIDIANIHIPSTSNQQPTHSGKHPCTELNCGKHFLSNADLKRHLRTHSNVRPYGCTFPGCSKEFGRRHHAINHILSMHLKKKKMPEDAVEERDNNNEPPDPAIYLIVKEDLL